MKVSFKAKRWSIWFLYALIAFLLTIPLGVTMSNSDRIKRNTDATNRNTKTLNIVVKQQGELLAKQQETIAAMNEKIDRQTRLIECLLSVHGTSLIISEEAKAACRQEADGNLPVSGTSTTQPGRASGTAGNTQGNRQNSQNPSPPTPPNPPDPPDDPDEPEDPPLTIETPIGDIPVCVEILNLCVR